MYAEIIEKLDTVLKLNQKKNQAVHKVWNTPYKTVARTSLPMSNIDRFLAIDDITKRFNAAANKVYESINEQLAENGKDTINNPFLKGDL